MSEIGFQSGEILLPKGIDMEKWSIVACDQYTSEPEYWETVKKLVGESPSALKITLPEIYLEQADVSEKIQAINAEMRRYLMEKVLVSTGNRYLYVERTLKSGAVRKGLVGVVDLEQYCYTPGAQSLIRATEGTVLERIPPRMRVRENAVLETPHVMLLIDDDKKTVVEPISAQKDNLEKVYDFKLMMDSGYIQGYKVSAPLQEKLETALSLLADPDVFCKKYGVSGKGTLLFAVGDGNHSLATAKASFEQIKELMPKKEWENHPARWALVEVVNLHDSALEFEPIHRVLFGVSPEKVLETMKTYYDVSETEISGGQSLSYCFHEGAGKLWIRNPTSNLEVGTLQNFIDNYLKEHGGKVDYIHGEDVVERLSREPGNLGFLLPNMEKSQLFRTVILDGVLPRKTFSMGHACDKRFYLECRKIK